MTTEKTPEAFAGLVTALVFKTGEASEKALGGFDSHPLPLLRAALCVETRISTPLPIAHGSLLGVLETKGRKRLCERNTLTVLSNASLIEFSER